MVKSVSPLNRETLKKRNKEFVKIRMVIYVLLGFIIVIGGLTILCFGDSLLGAIYTVLGIIFPSIMYFVAKKQASGTTESMSALIDSGLVVTFCFDNDGFSIHEETTLNASYLEDAKISYDVIYRLTESKDYFMIYMSKRQVYLVDKQTITEGTVDELRSYFMMKIPYEKVRLLSK